MTVDIRSGGRAGSSGSTVRRSVVRCVWLQDDAGLRARLWEISKQRPQWGCGVRTSCCARNGWGHNRKRTQRLWRDEGLRAHGSAYFEPGSPMQNPCVESFGSWIRDELLAVELFSCLAEAKVTIQTCREGHNERRPHSALKMMAPSRFAQARRAQHDAVAISLRSPLRGVRSD